ncbi:MAG: DUF6473 family protein [Pseudomonadota bacterium]
MTYEHPGGGSLDYDVCRYGKSRLLVRGPKARLVPPYTLFLGGTETYGRFVPEPFPAQIKARLGLNVVNVSCINAGLDAFAEDRTLLAMAAAADTTVVQIIGAANLSNELYTVHPRRNDRFLAATPALRALYPEVDFTEFSFTRHLLSNLQARCPARFATVTATLKDRWRVQMHRLMAEAGARRILLWVAAAPPPDRACSIENGSDPLLVDRAMVAEFGAQADEFVQVIPTAQARAIGTDGMVFTDFEAHIAEETINLATHAEIAQALAPVLRRQTQAA